MADRAPHGNYSENESRYHQLRDAVADYHYHVRLANGRVIEKQHGPNCTVITGYRPDEYAANSDLWFNIVHAEDRSVVERQIGQVVTGRPAAAIEYRIRCKDGLLRWIWKLVIPYHDADGRLTAYVLRDITERKQQEEALRQSEDHYRLLFEDDLTGDYVATPTGEILLCNRAFVDIFGFASREQAVGSNLANLYPCRTLGTLVDQLRELKSIERSERVTSAMTGPLGTSSRR